MKKQDKIEFILGLLYNEYTELKELDNYWKSSTGKGLTDDLLNLKLKIKHIINEAEKLEIYPS